MVEVIDITCTKLYKSKLNNCFRKKSGNFANANKWSDRMQNGLHFGVYAIHGGMFITFTHL
ncbi:MAG TPA: hypothetical protein DCW95_06590 [Chryseobacterium sp.]|nr:hypothetical protein [Chryseobacterium sp.]